MENCFIKKIKNVVENNNLIKKGHSVINLPISAGTVKVIGSDFKINDSQYSSNTTADIAAGKLEVLDKYNVENIQFTGACNIDFKDNISYWKKLRSINFSSTGSKINLSSLDNSPNLLIMQSQGCQNNYGTFENWKTQVLDTLDVHDNREVYGDIKYLGNQPLTAFNFYRTKITGTLESFFERRIAKGYLGNINSIYVGASSLVTFGGVSIAKDANTSSNVIYTTDNNNGTYTCGIAYGGLTRTHKYHGLYTLATNTWSNFVEEGI